MSRHVTVAEAAETLGVSRKTIERHIRSGRLSATKEGVSYIVELPENYKVQRRDRTKGSNVPKVEVEHAKTVATLEVVKSELESIREERDALIGRIENLSEELKEKSRLVERLSEAEKELAAVKAELEQVKGERDYLRKAHEASLVLVADQIKRLLPAPRQRPWWRFWERGEEAKEEG